MEIKYNRGFTLIEVLIVIVIVGIIVSIAVINPGNFQRKRAAAFTSELEQILKTTRQQAVLQSTTFGVSFFQNQYEFYRFDSLTNNWVSMQTVDKFWQNRAYPQHVNVNLNTEGYQQKTLAANIQPQIMFMPSGEVSPFILTVNLNNQPQFRLTGKFSGEITQIKIK